MKDVPSDQVDKMVEATLKNEIPLENAFGNNWREIFSPKIVKDLLLKNVN